MRYNSNINHVSAPLLLCLFVAANMMLAIGSGASAQPSSESYDQLTQRFARLKQLAEDLISRFGDLSSTNVVAAQREVDELTHIVSELLFDAKPKSRLHASIDNGVQWAKNQIDRIEADGSVSDEVRQARANRYHSEIGQLEAQKKDLITVHERLDLAFSKLTVYRSELAEEVLVGNLETTRAALGRFIDELQSAVAELETVVEGRQVPPAES